MPSLLLLHGFTGAPSSWGAVVESLPAGTRSEAPWLVGHGRPPAAPGVTSFEQEVERLAGWLAQDTRWVLAGYSLGARLGLALLQSHPSHFAAAVLVSGRIGLDSEAERAARALQDEKWCELLAEAGLAAFVERWAAQPLFASQATLSEADQTAELGRRLAHDPRGLIQSLRSTGLARMPSSAGKLGNVSAKVELLAGARDLPFCHHARAIVRELPHARFTSVPGAGHNLLLERPQAVAQAIARGLQS
jgi:2-succinyl-6-hydroxy-2,4-cyclohexadiene-1-carboxylate synthase